MTGGLRYLLVNQGWRRAWVLAELDGEVLVEYEMPHGTTSLRIIRAEAIEERTNPYPRDYRSVSYHALPRKWLRELARYDESWEGCPQQTYRPGTPSEELLRRFGERVGSEQEPA